VGGQYARLKRKAVGVKYIILAQDFDHWISCESETGIPVFHHAKARRIFTDNPLRIWKGARCFVYDIKCAVGGAVVADDDLYLDIRLGNYG